MIELRNATLNDIPVILNICDDARAFQREQGFMQWGDGYPSSEVIEADIHASKGFLILLDNAIVGYCVIDLSRDIEYDLHPEIWESDGDYAAVHRLALSHNARNKRLGHQIFATIEQYVSSKGIKIFKVDTGVENIRMQRIMDTSGYKNLGIHNFKWGIRIAYEKVLQK